jgi:predicted amidohydrolase YtcJ
MTNIVEYLGADLILTNGKVVTIDSQETIAQAVAIKDGRFLKAGTNEEIRGLAKSGAKVIDLNGRTVLPGFIDTHEHCIRRGLQSDYVDCGSTLMETIDDIVQALAAKAATKPEGEWVVGSRFDETKLKDHRWPNRYDLDRASDKHPIYLGRAGGHNSVANSMALASAGITKDTPQPLGARIEKDDQGEPTGRLDEVAAMNMVRSRIPTPGPKESIEIMVDNWPTIEETLLSWGLTTMGSSGCASASCSTAWPRIADTPPATSHGRASEQASAGETSSM